MASIYLDGQSRSWKVKFLDNGRDRRATLRKALDNEPRHPIPADVVEMARRRGFVFSTQRQDTGVLQHVEAAPPGDDAAPDDLLGFIDYYMADYGQTHRPGSIKRMEGILRHYRRFLATTDDVPKTVSQVNETHVLAWFNWRRQQTDPRLKITLKPWVVVGETEQLSGLFRLALDMGKLTTNPARRPLYKLRKAHPRPDPATETKYIDSETLPKTLDNIDAAVRAGQMPADYADLAKVMLFTGMRVEAALNMDYSWIDKDWVVKVPAEWDKAKTGYTTVVVPRGRPVLSRRRGLQVAGRVFPATMTQAMSYHYLRRFKITNHMMRHSFATALVDGKVAIQTISSMMGHHDIKTTQRYAKVRDRAKLEAATDFKFGT